MAAATLRPTNKTIATGLSGAVATILIYILNTYVSPERPMPAEIAAALTTVVGVALAWLTPPGQSETVVKNAEGAPRSGVTES